MVNAPLELGDPGSVPGHARRRIRTDSGLAGRGSPNGGPEELRIHRGERAEYTMIRSSCWAWSAKRADRAAHLGSFLWQPRTLPDGRRDETLAELPTAWRLSDRRLPARASGWAPGPAFRESTERGRSGIVKGARPGPGHADDLVYDLEGAAPVYWIPEHLWLGLAPYLSDVGSRSLGSRSRARSPPGGLAPTNRP